jgi:hypothetical protein
MGVKVGELYARLGLDKRPFESALSSAEGKARGWGSRVGGFLGKAAGSLLKWGSIAGGAAAAGAFFLGNKASDLNETISKSGVVFGKNAEDIQQWSRSAASSMGMSQNSALGAAATFGNLFVSMGIGAKPTKEMSTNLVELAGDLASFNNMDPTEVLEKLRSGLVGETEPLRSLGVNLNQVTIEAKAMELGLWDGEGAISAAAKSQAAYALILEQTGTAQGDFARTSDGMANQQRIVAATFEDTMARMGQAFTPLFEAILPKVSEGLTAFSNWVWENMPAIQEVIGTVLDYIGKGFEFVFGTILPALVDGFKTVSPVVSDVMGVVGEVIGFITEEVIPGLQEVFAGVVEWTKANWPTISSIIKQVGGAIIAVVKAVWPVVESVAKVLFPIVGKAAGVLLGAIDNAFKLIGGVVRVAAGVIRGVAETITNIWNGLVGTVKRVGDAIGNAWAIVANRVKGIWDGLSGAARTAWNAITSTIKGVINGVIRAINGFIGAINSIQIHIPKVGVGPVAVGPFDWWGLNLGYISYLARGTRNFPGGFAVVGEQGPELVHLPGGTRVWPHGEGPGGSIMVNGPLVHIDNFSGSNAELDRLTRQLASRLRLRTGRTVALPPG